MRKKYNNKTIDELHAKDVFDDNYDHIVLKQSDEERKYLKDKLLDSQNREKGLSPKRKRRTLTKKSKSTINNEDWESLDFINNIFLFVLSFLFGKNGKNYLLRRRTNRSLIRSNIYYYDYRIKKINVEFAHTVYNDIYLQLRDISILFEEVFKEKNTINFGKKIFLLDLVYPLLSPETRDILNSINENYFAKIIANTQSPERALSDVLSKLKKSIIKNDKIVITSYTRNIELLVIISQFDFKKLFKIFDYHFIEDDKYTPNFQPAFGEKYIPILKQLNSYFMLLNMDQFTENTISHFANTLKVIKKKVGINLDEIKKEKNEKEKNEELLFDKDIILPIYTKTTLNNYSLSNLFNKIAFFNNKEVLESIIKLMDDNYDYTPIKIQDQKNILFNTYIHLVIEKQKHFLKNSFDEIKNSIVHKEICSLFNIPSVEELMEIENYTEEINRQLIDRELGRYSYIEPIRVFKTFYHKKYKKSIRKIINTIVMEGDFIQKKEEKLFIDYYYKLNEHLTKLSDLEVDFAKESKELKNIISLVKDTENDGQKSMLINKNINQLEKDIRIIIREGTNYYKALSDYLEKIQADSVKLKPEVVANIKSIHGTSNKKLITILENAIDNLKHFHKIIMLYPFMKGKAFGVMKKRF